MRRWETLAALGAVIAASIGALHVPGRFYGTVAALVLLAIVGVSRLRAALGRSRAETDAAQRARRIREQRHR